MIALGLGATIGGLISGLIADKFGSLASGRICMCFFISSCGCFIAALHWQQLWLTLIAGFMWGFSLFYVEGWMFMVCSRFYQGKA